MEWFDLLAVQGTLKSLLQHHSSKASILWHSAVFMVQLSHPYVTTGKTIALTTWTFVGKVMPLHFNMLSRLVIPFLPRSKRLLISWLRSPSASLDSLVLSICSIYFHTHILPNHFENVCRQYHAFVLSRSVVANSLRPNCSPPGSSVHGTRILEQVAMPSSRETVSYLTLNTCICQE